jgi:JmjC domain
VIADLIGGSDERFRGARWPREPEIFRARPEWFERIASLSVLRDPDEWLDRAPELMSFSTHDILARSEARRRYLAGESIYIIGLDRAVKPLRDLCDDLARDLALSPSNVMVQAWAAGGATSVAMHYDLDYNFNLQVTGRKEWQAASNDLVANPIRSYHAAAGAPSVAVDSGREMPIEMPADARRWYAAPGDVVYMPQGTWHATRTEEATVAMAFVIQPPTWGEHVAKALRDRLHGSARWRERVLGARDLSRHAAIEATAREALAASRVLLADVGPSEVLYHSFWGQNPASFRRRDGVTDWSLERTTGILAWQCNGERREVAIPTWAQVAVGRMVSAADAWSIVVMHDLVGADAATFLNILVSRLTEAGFLESVPVASGGIAHRH